MLKVIGIIPARFASVRFPGKPLVEILGKSLIQHVYENALRCKILDQVVIATDDERIFKHARGFGAWVVMTSPDCPTGTDRLAEVLMRQPELNAAQVIVNIQGDEPTLDPHVIRDVAEVLLKDPRADVSTALIPIESEEEALNPSVVKCVIDDQGYALYFSRGLIPAGKALRFNPATTYYRHLGLYGYRRDFLLHYADLSPSPLQLAEDLEQLRVLEHGYKIKTTIVHTESMDVNTPEDLKKLERLLCKQNTSS